MQLLYGHGLENPVIGRPRQEARPRLRSDAVRGEVPQQLQQIIAPDTAAAIERVPGVKQDGDR